MAEEHEFASPVPMEAVAKCRESRASPDLHISSGKLLCALGVGCVGGVGPYLYSLGHSDITKGLTASGSAGTCGWKPLFDVLGVALFVCCVLRALFAPAFWTLLCERRDYKTALKSPLVICWLALFLTPFLCLTSVIFGVVPHVTDFHRTISEWPSACKVERPYQGLFSTRCWAAFGAYLSEGLWHMWIIYWGTDSRRRVGGISVASFLFYLFMLAGGPLSFLGGVDDSGHCDDAWIAETYIAVTILAFAGMLPLLHVNRCIPQAVTAANTALGSHGHWASLLWNALAVLQLVVLEVVVRQGQQLKPGPPWIVCGTTFKEFFYPRHKGLLFFCYAQLLGFNLWLLGCALWHRAESDDVQVLPACDCEDANFVA
mmetsp:Transcript_97613/g.209446  ORF Transcript_97613/g.209446 Transcript_97613/m.209446 type:complete len:373 (-) Transcript_97613:112-1230(-)